MSKRNIKSVAGVRLAAILALLGTTMSVNAQQGSQGNTKVFGGAEITVFGSHNFVTGGSGTQPGIIKTIRTSPFGIVKFGTSATQTGATDASHVDGYVTKIGSTAFTFPVGNGTDLRTLAISAPAAATSRLNVAWFSGSPGTVSDPSDGTTHSTTAVSGTLLSVSEAGFWDWIPVTGSFAGTTVTVSIPNLSAFALTANLRLAAWNGTAWIDISNSATATGNTEGSFLSGTIPATGTISAIGIASTADPLPVKLISFSAKEESGITQLRWATTEEINAERFNVERSSDAKTWQYIGEKEADGESKSLTEYYFTDHSPKSGINYYRLKMIDKDATFAYSHVKSVKIMSSESVVSAYPNPVSGTLYLKNLDPSTIQEIAIININGITAYRSSDKKIDKLLATGIQVGYLVDGIYIVKITGKDGLQNSHRIVVSK